MTIKTTSAKMSQDPQSQSEGNPIELTTIEIRKETIAYLNRLHKTHTPPISVGDYPQDEEETALREYRFALSDAQIRSVLPADKDLFAWAVEEGKKVDINIALRKAHVWREIQKARLIKELVKVMWDEHEDEARRRGDKLSQKEVWEVRTRHVDLMRDVNYTISSNEEYQGRWSPQST